MPEQIPFGVAESIINRLASLAFREFGRIYGITAELEKLKSTLESIKAVLLDAEERQDQDRTVRNWISRLKQVLHDADDLLDDLLIEDLRRKVNGYTYSKHVAKVRDFFSSPKQVAFRHKMARKMEKIRQQFNDISEDMSKLKLNERVVILKQNESDWRETSSFVLQSDLIGREESKSEIINLLKQTQTNQNVSLIAIVGIGGLGKTALAQLVYNDTEVQELFQKQMWVCVSKDFEVKLVLNKMLKSLNNGEVRDQELDQLQKKLQEELNGQRYMLVLDDVWNESHLKWNALRTYLMCGGQGSKILVTTRSEIVAQTMGINTPYVLKGLKKEQSWDLLKNLAFGEDAKTISPNLVSIGERIAEKCGGVPLAIKTMGGFLRSKNEESEWLSILEGDFWKQCKERESIMPVLKLSYQNLPLELRQCFTYCSLYPKDWEINKNELIQLWMAQGYLECSTESQSMEDMGNQYVKILLMRSFFQDASMNEYNDISSLKMHDLMHDLAMSVAGNDCCLDSDGKGIVGGPMHVSFVSDTICSMDLVDASKLRTFLWCKNQKVYMIEPRIITNFKYLRVLDLSFSCITSLPKSICKFKHLRYLDLSFCDDLTSLPKSIGNLVSLQTLKLKGCKRLLFSIEIITKLISLRYLDIEDCKAFKEMMPAGMGKLTSLQYLSKYVVGSDEKTKSGKLNELNHLNNIRGCLKISELGLVKNVASESQEANLKAKKHIQRVKMNWGYFNEQKDSDSLQLLDNLCPHQNLRELTVTRYPGVRFSSWLPSITNIVEINLYGLFDCQHLPPLERLSLLKRLRIDNMWELKYIPYEDLEISHVFFPSLEILRLTNCHNLWGWQNNDTNDADTHLALPPFPRLSYLQIRYCSMLTCMPTCPHVKHLDIREAYRNGITEEWMRSLTSLEHLSVRGTSIISPMLKRLQYLPVELKELEIDEELIFPYEWKGEEDVLKQWQTPQVLRSLQKISIRNCRYMKALPEWICDLPSLRHIFVDNCNFLKSLPEGMPRLTNLQTLHLRHCHNDLRARCRVGTGAYWPNIDHIPEIIVD